MFLGFLKTVLWVMAITIPIMWWLPDSHGTQRSRGMSTAAAVLFGMAGVGAALVPGGNDVLILHATPGLSPHALPAYLAMVIGIGLPLLLMRVVPGTAMRVDCSSDVCRTGPERDRASQAVSGTAD